MPIDWHEAQAERWPQPSVRTPGFLLHHLMGNYLLTCIEARKRFFCEAKSPVKYSGHAGLCFTASLIAAALLGPAGEAASGTGCAGPFISHSAEKGSQGLGRARLGPQMLCVHVCVCTCMHLRMHAFDSVHTCFFLSAPNRVCGVHVCPAWSEMACPFLLGSLVRSWVPSVTHGCREAFRGGF